MAKEIKFSLVYRDMWQSSGKYQPRVDQLVRVAPAIIDMGCFDRVETNGGAFEQVNLLYGENPNVAVRKWTAPFHKAGIQTHMLERGLNALRMNPVPADVRELMFKVKKAQGTDISRSFCGLNDPRNLKLSIEYARKAGMISQAALSITHSPIHTVEYYLQLVDKLGGVTVEVPEGTYYAGVSVPAGDAVQINGQEALVLARCRHGNPPDQGAYAMGDYQRTLNQRNLMVISDFSKRPHGLRLNILILLLHEHSQDIDRII